MKKFLFSSIAVALLSVSSVAIAEPEPSKHPLRVGFGLDVGVPSGAALGVVVHPKIDWVSVQLSLTHNTMAFGGRGSVKLDPLTLLPNVPIGVFGDLQGGFTGKGNVPGTTDFPQVGYQYVNLYGGLRLGKPNGFHWNFEVGPSYINASTEGFQAFAVKNGANGVTVSEPTVSAWVTPTFITGFEVVWP